MRHGISACITLVLLLLSLSTHAGLVNFSIEGVVDSVDAQNVYGLAVGDSISASAMFDDSLISASGESFVELGESGNAASAMLTFTVGGLPFDASNEVDFIGDVFPLLIFLNGVFDGFDYMAEAGVNGATAKFDVDGFGFLGDNGLSGSFNLQSVSLVPEPMTLGLACLGLAGVVRARQRTAAVPT